ncbi:hypothetical protein BDN67DRAFT_883171, partial [Paxillus ammoniavirescens]
GSGHAIYEKQEHNELFVAIAVMKAINFKLNANPSGMCLGSNFDPLEKAKFQFYSTCPLDPAFKDNFSQTYAMLEKLQNAVA